MIFYIDAINLHGWAMTQALTYAGYDYVDFSFEKIFATEDDSKIVHFVKLKMGYTDHEKKQGFS